MSLKSIWRLSGVGAGWLESPALVEAAGVVVEGEVAAYALVCGVEDDEHARRAGGDGLTACSVSQRLSESMPQSNRSSVCLRSSGSGCHRPWWSSLRSWTREQLA